MKLYLEWINEFVDISDKSPQELNNNLSLINGTELPSHSNN